MGEREREREREKKRGRERERDRGGEIGGGDILQAQTVVSCCA